jgi:S1-C subfamily serine protease
MRVSRFGVSAAGAVLVATTTAVTAQQPLGRVADKTVEQRKAVGQPAKVITNADLKDEDGRLIDTPAGDNLAGAAVSLEPLTDATRESLIKTVMPAVVTIQAGNSLGSGFFAGPALVVTNKHVVTGTPLVRVTFSDGRSSGGVVTSTSVDADLALVHVDDPPPSHPNLRLGSGRNVPLGAEVLAFGSPLGLQSTVTRGIVSAIRVVDGLTLVQTDAAINPGNSGGPLVVSDGSVVGINTLKAAAESLGFAIAIDHAKLLIDGRTAVARQDGTSPPKGQTSLTMVPGGQSESAQARERATAAYERAVAILGREANDVDVGWRRYVRGCATETPQAVPGGRDWFALWSSSAAPNGGAGGCGALLSDIAGAAGQIRGAMQGLEDAARRADVYPGARREIRRKYSMDWDGWDR